MAATGTPTPNIGLRRAQGTDPASVDDINYNSALIDTKLGAVGNSSVQDQIDTLNTKIENVIVQAVQQVDPGTTETEYTFINSLKLSDYKMLVATRSWYSNVLQSQCIPTNAFNLAPLEVKDGNDFVKVTFVSDTKVKIVSSIANMRCSIFLTR